MKTLTGINRPHPVANPLFAGYNRVLVEKSSYDRYLGRVAYRRPGGFFSLPTASGRTLRFDLYQQGYLIILEALRALENGLACRTWVPGAG